MLRNFDFYTKILHKFMVYKIRMNHYLEIDVKYEIRSSCSSKIFKRCWDSRNSLKKEKQKGLHKMQACV